MTTTSSGRKKKIVEDEWTTADASRLYHVEKWGRRYFSVSDKGTVMVHPERDPDRSIDLKELVDQLQIRGIHAPLLLRFTDILRHRVREIARAFDHAIEENDYRGRYRCVFPIKVNQQKHVAEEICDFGSEHGFGLEAGSKPELLAVLAMVGNRDVPIICNGFKDDEFCEMVVLAQKIGKRVIPVIEKFSELERIVRFGERHGIKPQMGIRVKLSTRGAGRWESSGGARSKFGLFISEVIEAIDYLKERDLQDCLCLLHFHLGSQITNIRNVKDAVNELSRIYVQIKKAGAGLSIIDVGGGLGVDYDGSQTNAEASTNYTLEEYASDIVYHIKMVCDDAGVDHPTIISESGRALVAYHSVLIFNVLGISGFDGFTPPETLPTKPKLPQPLVALHDAWRGLTRKNFREYYHDASQAHDQAMALFNLGYLTLEQRALAEQMYWAACMKVLEITQRMKRVPKELQGLSSTLADTYFCNVSIFQSMPDSWAIDQLFPILPIHRLDERPTRRGILADITCDSDGKIDRFISANEPKNVLELHNFDGGDYFIGAFLVGAYQEILGDLHNLFGDTHAVHVSLDEDGLVDIEHIIPGDTVRESLSYVQYNADELAGMMRRDVERAVKLGHIGLAESAQLMRFYQKGLEGYTYLEGSPDEA